MFKLRTPVAAAAFGLAVGLVPRLRLRRTSKSWSHCPRRRTSSSAFIAEDAGFYKKGLKVSHRTIVGVARANAVIAGAADFTIGTGPVFLRAAASGQRLLAIANLIDRPLVELVLRKDVADAAGITEKTPFAERAKALKGKTIGIQGVGSIVHAWERLVVNRGGLDVEKDVRIAPMDPPGMLAGLQTKALDGFATSLPFTTEAVVKGAAIMLASGASDAPDLLPFAYGLIYTRPDMCSKEREKCRASPARSPPPTSSFWRSRPRRWKSSRSGSTRWTSRCWRRRGRRCRKHTPRTCGSRWRGSTIRRRSASRRSFLKQRTS